MPGKIQGADSSLYLWADSGRESARSISKHGYSSVYRVTDCKRPFDIYTQEPILCPDEFRSSLPMGEAPNYLDGYPNSLPTRYANGSI